MWFVFDRFGSQSRLRDGMLLVTTYIGRLLLSLDSSQDGGRLFVFRPAAVFLVYAAPAHVSWFVRGSVWTEFELRMMFFRRSSL